jgi:hypothetical protein
LRYSSPQSPGTCVVEANAASSRAWSSASSLKAKSFRLSIRCSLSPSLAPTMTAATADFSSTQRVATLATETLCLRAMAAAASRIACTALQPPMASMKRLYLDFDQSGTSAPVGSGLPTQRSVRNPPPSVP